MKVLGNIILRIHLRGNNYADFSIKVERFFS